MLRLEEISEVRQLIIEATLASAPALQDALKEMGAVKAEIDKKLGLVATVEAAEKLRGEAEGLKIAEEQRAKDAQAAREKMMADLEKKSKEVVEATDRLKEETDRAVLKQRDLDRLIKAQNEAHDKKMRELLDRETRLHSNEQELAEKQRRLTEARKRMNEVQVG